MSCQKINLMNGARLDLMSGDLFEWMSSTGCLLTPAEGMTSGDLIFFYDF